MWADFFSGTPDLGKLAVDGCWEEAVAFAPGELTSAAEVEALVGDATDVACEAFFGQAFFGTRQTSDGVDFVLWFARALARPGFFEEVGQRFPLGRDFEYAELGAEGAWRSVGAYRLGDLDRLWDDLQEHPVWLDTTHEKALEFSYANGDGTTHWFALPVSEGGRISWPMVQAALWEFTA